MTTTQEAHPAADAEPSELERHIDLLQDRKDAWARLPVPRRLEYLRSILDGTVRTAEAQVRAACEAKGLKLGTPAEAEEWLGGPVIQARVVRTLIDTLEHVAATGRPPLDPGRVSTRPDGRVVYRGFPGSALDKVLYSGFTGDVWMQPQVTRESLPEHMGAIYTKPALTEGRVSLVLGAGNVASIGPLDLVHKLFFEGQVGLLKFNPVNAYLAPFVEEAFADLIRDGFVRTTAGGPESGAFLVAHPGIEEIHITGSDRTHDAIVYGPGEEGRRRKEADEPLVDKRITSELGNVSPVIVMPGDWSEGDLEFQAQNVATQLTNNAGFNCNASRVLVVWSRWPQRKAFLDRLSEVLATVPQRPAYYPGAEDRYERFVAAHPQATRVGERTDGVLPWVVVRDLDPADHDDPCYTTEAFCGLMGETALDADSPAAFLDEAVRFANDRLWGTLNACVIVDPKTRSREAEAVDAAVAGLKYGTVAVNHWPALSFALGTTTWGAYPGHTRQDIQSGVGVVHNTLLFDAPEKTVIEGPFRVRPKPPWFVTHKAAHQVARRLVDLEARPRWSALPPLLVHALRG